MAKFIYDGSRLINLDQVALINIERPDKYLDFYRIGLSGEKILSGTTIGYLNQTEANETLAAIAAFLEDKEKNIFDFHEYSKSFGKNA